MRHARNTRRLKYGQALLRVFVKKPNVALNSTLRMAMGISTQHTFPTDLSIVKNEITGLLITTPSGVVNKIKELETVALSTIPREHHFPGSALSDRPEHHPSP
jgi:hypothetical protein